MTRLLIALALLLLARPAPALAWWDYGHRTVATIAWDAMSPASRRAAMTLVRRSAALDTPSCRVRSLEDAAVWPDCVKSLGDRFSYMSSWHYQDIDVCLPFQLKGTCPDGNCVTVQIERQARLLADRTIPARERLTALALLVHFVGDMHQPLHVAEHHDQGGNAIKVRYGAISYPKLSLHTVWDGLMAERLISEPPPIEQSITPERRTAWRQGKVADWALEVWQRGRDVTYARLPVADACAIPKDARLSLGEAYVADARETVRLGVQQAGVRAALLIDRALDPGGRSRD